MKNSIKTFLILGIIFFSTTTGYAIENLQKTANLLDSIEIKSINNTYEITLETTNAVPLKTNVSGNKMFIDLKGITPSSTVNTIYNNASTIDNILIQPNGKDTRIIIQGTNLNHAQVLVNTSKVPASMLFDNTKKEITLNRSIDSYSPIIPEESTYDFGNMFSLSTIDLSELLRPSTIGWLLGLTLILMVLIKNLKTERKPKKTSEFSPKDIMRQKQELLKNSKEKEVKEIPSIEEELKEKPIKLNLEEELTKAHHRFNESIARRQSLPKQNASLKNYGIKEYKNSQIDPYQKITKKPSDDFLKGNTTDVLKATTKIGRKSPTKQSVLQKPATKTNIPQSSAPKTTITRQDLQKAQQKLKNMRFLDKMSQIYEQNGRKDLAQNIKEKIYKNK